MKYYETVLGLIGEKYPLTERDCGRSARVKVGPMTFKIRAFDAEGLGNVSLMHGSAMLGTMQMDTIIVNPFERDMALFSYDRINAMGNDTLFLEIYDTRMERGSYPDALSQVVASYADIPSVQMKPNWYDDIRFPESIEKKGTRDLTPRFNTFTEQYLQTYLQMCADAASCDAAAKKRAASAYTEGLLSNGGPSTDNFVKAKGLEFTQKLFREILFATGNPS